jgi:hypothetical protein
MNRDLFQYIESPMWLSAGGEFWFPELQLNVLSGNNYNSQMIAQGKNSKRKHWDFSFDVKPLTAVYLGADYMHREFSDRAEFQHAVNRAEIVSRLCGKFQPEMS